MQEDKQLIICKRKNEILSKSIALAMAVIISGCAGFFVSTKESYLENEKMKVALRDYGKKIELQQMTNQYKEFKNELEKEIEESKIVQKIVEPAAVTYISYESEKNESGNSTAPTEYKSVIDVKATAYCLCKKCCGKSENNPEYGVTRSGLKIVPGTDMKVIAVDPKVIPLGSKVYVEGLNGAQDYGYAIAADTGSAIKNQKIDLYMDSHEDTMIWGIKNMRVYIIK